MHLQFSSKEWSGPIIEEMSVDEDAAVATETDPSVIEDLLDFNVDDLLSLFIKFDSAEGNKILLLCNKFVLNNISFFSFKFSRF